MSYVHKNTWLYLSFVRAWADVFLCHTDQARHVYSVRKQENRKVQSCCCYFSERFSILGVLAGWCNPSSYAFSLFESWLYFQAGLLKHVKHNMNSLVLAGIWSDSWKDVLIGLIGLVIKLLWSVWELGVDLRADLSAMMASASGSVPLEKPLVPMVLVLCLASKS